MACTHGRADGSVAAAGARAAWAGRSLHAAAHAARRHLERRAQDRAHAAAARWLIAYSSGGRRHGVLSASCSDLPATCRAAGRDALLVITIHARLAPRHSYACTSLTAPRAARTPSPARRPISTRAA